MTIVYPLPLPAPLPAQSCKIRDCNLVGQSRSAFTAGSQSHKWPGEWWELDMAFPPLDRVELGPWRGFLARLHGNFGTFLAGDPGYLGPNGIATGAPVVDGDDQAGYTLQTTGWTESQSGILLSGDYFGLGTGSLSRLYMLTADADSDAGGNAELEFWPALRTSPADGATIILANPVTVFKLNMPNDTRGPDIDSANLSLMTMVAREELPE